MRNLSHVVSILLAVFLGVLITFSYAEGLTSRKLLQGELPVEAVVDGGQDMTSAGAETTPGAEAATVSEGETAEAASATDVGGAVSIEEMGGQTAIGIAASDPSFDYAAHLPSHEQMASLYSRHVEPAMAMAEKHLYPQIQRHSVHVASFKNSTERLFKEAHGRVTAHLTRLTGHDADLVPEWLQYLSYSMLLFPLLVWVMLLAYFFTQMAMAGIVFTMAKCGNLFWTIYCLFLAIMTFVISDEPLFFFHQSHPSEYVAFQFVKAALFCTHLLVLLIQCVSEVSFLNVVQWVGSTLIGVHYYLNAWHPAMMEEPPLLGFKYYAFYMYCFFIFFILPSSAKYLHKYRNE